MRKSSVETLSPRSHCCSSFERSSANTSCTLRFNNHPCWYSHPIATHRWTGRAHESDSTPGCNCRHRRNRRGWNPVFRNGQAPQPKIAGALWARVRSGCKAGRRSWQGRRVLEFREKRREKFKIRPLSAADRSSFAVRWNEVQSRFVDDSRAAVTVAESLVSEVAMGSRRQCFDRGFAHRIGSDFARPFSGCCRFKEDKGKGRGLADPGHAATRILPDPAPQKMSCADAE